VSLWSRVYAERRVILLPLGLVLVINVAVLLLAVLPLQSSVAAMEEAATSATLDLANARRLQQQARHASASRDRAEDQLKKFYTQVLPADFTTATKTTNRWLQQAAKDAGLEYRSARYDWDPIRESALSRAFSTVTLRGRYDNIRRFLHAVESAEEFIVVESVEVTQQDAASEAVTDGQLELALVVSTYFAAPR
jgi:Tfp pilus assembly protein PilO